jgi:hypothetical protein
MVWWYHTTIPHQLTKNERHVKGPNTVGSFVNHTDVLLTLRAVCLGLLKEKDFLGNSSMVRWYGMVWYGYRTIPFHAYTCIGSRKFCVHIIIAATSRCMYVPTTNSEYTIVLLFSTHPLWRRYLGSRGTESSRNFFLSRKNQYTIEVFWH